MTDNNKIAVHTSLMTSDQLNEYIERVANDLNWTQIGRPGMFKTHMDQIIEYSIRDIEGYKPITGEEVLTNGNRVLCVLQRTSEKIRERLEAENTLNAEMEHHAVIVEEMNKALMDIKVAVVEVNLLMTLKGASSAE